MKTYRFAKKGSLYKDIEKLLHKMYKEADIEENIEEWLSEPFKEFFDYIEVSLENTTFDIDPETERVVELDSFEPIEEVCEPTTQVPQNFKSCILQCNGFEALGFKAGGDWQEPVFFIFYINSNGNLDLFMPTEGNMPVITEETLVEDEDFEMPEVFYDSEKILSNINECITAI